MGANYKGKKAEEEADVKRWQQMGGHRADIATKEEEREVAMAQREQERTGTSQQGRRSLHAVAPLLPGCAHLMESLRDP